MARRRGGTHAVAFALLELLVMVVVLGLLAVMVIPGFNFEKRPDPTGIPHKFPEFPWEPPTPTTYARIPDEFGLMERKGQTYGDLATRLEIALSKAGYSEKAYYSVPGGFALVCRLEQVDKNWVPVPPPDRWGENTPSLLRNFSLAEYIERLFLAKPGHYRLLVFVVIDQPFGFSRRIATKEAGEKWIFGGASALPAEMARAPAATDTKCFALVYEFKKDDPKRPAEFVHDETIGTLIQLQRSGMFL